MFAMLSATMVNHLSARVNLCKTFVYLCYFVVYNVLGMGRDGSVVKVVI